MHKFPLIFHGSLVYRVLINAGRKRGKKVRSPPPRELKSTFGFGRDFAATCSFPFRGKRPETGRLVADFPSRLKQCEIRFLSVADEVDVIGYTSNQSDDSDDHSSVQSSIDSGVAMSTSRLTLAEMMDNL